MGGGYKAAECQEESKDIKLRYAHKASNHFSPLAFRDVTLMWKLIMRIPNFGVFIPLCSNVVALIQGLLQTRVGPHQITPEAAHKPNPSSVNLKIRNESRTAEVHHA